MHSELKNTLWYRRTFNCLSKYCGFYQWIDLSTGQWINEPINYLSDYMRP